MEKLIIFAIILLIFCNNIHTQIGYVKKYHPLRAEYLWCEYPVDSWGIDIAKPSSSWVFWSGVRNKRQTAYRVQVASTPELLTKDKADLWDSDKVMSNQSIHIRYAGKPFNRHFGYQTIS